MRRRCRLGNDRVRFTAPARIGDTVSVTYRIKDIDPDRRRGRAEVIVANQHGDTVAVAEHIVKWTPTDWGAARLAAGVANVVKITTFRPRYGDQRT